ncbi:MAG: type II toxin-antitoxin system HicA family toxin [Candidatus Brocadia sp.]|nr:MAG: type II toxin-antitoxin system HicA family toxin [Candidatus Brocadia sp.]
MPKFGPIKRKDLIRYLRQLGFIGPYSGGKHQFMVKEKLKVRIPNPHKDDIGENLLKQILKEIGIDRTKWEEL